MSCTNKNRDCKLDVGRGAQFCNCGDEVSASVCCSCFKLHATDWLDHMPNAFNEDIFEVRFKNTRRGYFRNTNNLPLKKGDVVAVEAAPGHDIGIVSLTGDLVARQMKRVGFMPMNGEFLKIYRKAKPYDIERWQEAIALEHETMIRSRQIAEEMGLDMKIGDVEYQGDRIKAIFYYIADQRVDFRELIKVFAREFRIRVEMRQIGARQEAGRIGGIGSCGRELCCSSWISNFISVTTNCARTQELSLNPQKLAGQCSKLKCCLVYELDNYIESQKEFPKVYKPIQATDGEYFLVKRDILTRTMSFSTSKDAMVGIRTFTVEQVKEFLALNKQGKKVDMFRDEYVETPKSEEPGFINVIGEDSITRFDNEKEERRERSNNRRRRRRPRKRDNDRSDNKQQSRGGRSGGSGEKKQGDGEQQSSRPRRRRGRRRPQNQGGGQQGGGQQGGGQQGGGQQSGGQSGGGQQGGQQKQQGGRQEREAGERRGGNRSNRRRSSRNRRDGGKTNPNREGGERQQRGDRQRGERQQSGQQGDRQRGERQQGNREGGERQQRGDRQRGERQQRGDDSGQRQSRGRSNRGRGGNRSRQNRQNQQNRQSRQNRENKTGDN